MSSPLEKPPLREKLRNLHRNELARAIVIVLALAIGIFALLRVGLLGPPTMLHTVESPAPDTAPDTEPKPVKPLAAAPHSSAEAASFDLPTTQRISVITLRDFRAQDQMVSIPSSQTRLTLVNFFASWCAPCRAEWPLLRELNKIDDLRMVGLGVAGDRALPDFLEVMGDPFDRIAIDNGGRVMAKLEGSGLPETYVIDRKGRIVFNRAGPLLREDVAKIRKLVEGSDLPPTAEADGHTTQ